MPAQSAQPAPRRGVGGVFVDIGPLRRHRAFRRLWTGQLASQVASQLTIVAVTYQTYRLTGSTAMVGLVSLGQLVPLLAGLVGRESRLAGYSLQATGFACHASIAITPASATPSASNKGYMLSADGPTGSMLVPVHTVCQASRPR